MVGGRVCIVGGSGFVGHAVTSELAKSGYTVDILTRRRESHRDLLVMPSVSLTEGNVYDPEFLSSRFSLADTVINLAGILNERGRNGSGFERAHVELGRVVVNVCRHAGVKRLLHMSALNASQSAPSHYLRTKGEAEKLVLAAATDNFHVTVFRPSVIFGPDDSFINRFAGMIRLLPGHIPVPFPLACAGSRFQPVYVQDVARAFVRSIKNPLTHNKSYALCGPQVYTLSQIICYIGAQLGRNVTVIPLGKVLSRMQAEIFEWLPPPLNKFKPFSVDNYRSLQVDSVCTEGFPEIFGIQPEAMENVVPCYLGDSRDDFYSCYRRLAGRGR